MKFPHFAYETRYVGSVRTILSQTFDAYLLKSLDGGFAESYSAETMLVRQCGPERKQKCIFLYSAASNLVAITFHKETREAQVCRPVLLLAPLSRPRTEARWLM